MVLTVGPDQKNMERFSFDGRKPRSITRLPEIFRQKNLLECTTLKTQSASSSLILTMPSDVLPRLLPNRSRIRLLDDSSLRMWALSAKPSRRSIRKVGFKRQMRISNIYSVLLKRKLRERFWSSKNSLISVCVPSSSRKDLSVHVESAVS